MLPCTLAKNIRRGAFTGNFRHALIQQDDLIKTLLVRTFKPGQVMRPRQHFCACEFIGGGQRAFFTIPSFAPASPQLLHIAGEGDQVEFAPGTRPRWSTVSATHHPDCARCRRAATGIGRHYWRRSIGLGFHAATRNRSKTARRPSLRRASCARSGDPIRTLLRHRCAAWGKHAPAVHQPDLAGRYYGVRRRYGFRRLWSRRRCII